VGGYTKGKNSIAHPLPRVEAAQECTSLQFIYTRKLNFSQSIWDKRVWWYWELHWNIVGGYTKGKKIPLLTPSPPLPFPKEKKLGPPECMLNRLIGCMKFVFLKLFVTILDLG
jgi:hypothetical protein